MEKSSLIVPIQSDCQSEAMVEHAHQSRRNPVLYILVLGPPILCQCRVEEIDEKVAMNGHCFSYDE